MQKVGYSCLFILLIVIQIQLYLRVGQRETQSR